MRGMAPVKPLPVKPRVLYDKLDAATMLPDELVQRGVKETPEMRARRMRKQQLMTTVQTVPVAPPHVVGLARNDRSIELLAARASECEIAPPPTVFVADEELLFDLVGGLT